MGISDGDLSPRGTRMGKKCPPQAFVGIPAGKFFGRGDGFGELKPDGEFPVAIPRPVSHRTVRCHTGLSGVPAEQRLLRAQRSTATAFNALQCAPESEYAQLAHRTVYMTCPVHHRTAQRPHLSELQRSNPNGRLTWLAHCPVRHATADFQRPHFGGWGYKYPNHPTFNCIQVFHLQHITRAIAFNSRHSKEIKSSPKFGITPNQIVTRESDICVHLSSCAWITSFLSHSSCDQTQL
jgi:hypothetical protein